MLCTKPCTSIIINCACSAPKIVLFVNFKLGNMKCVLYIVTFTHKKTP